MQAELQTTPTGQPSLRRGHEWLEDETDPVAGAAACIREDQVAGADHVVLFGAGLGYRILWLRELGVARPIVFEPEPSILELSRNAVPGALEGAATFTNYSSLLAHLRTELSCGERMVLLAPPGYQRAFPAEHQKVQECLRDAQGFAQLRRNTVDERLVHLVESALHNLPKLARVPAMESVSSPLASRPAFIVSAGPSLDGNAHLIPDAAQRGAIIAVNTSAPVIAAQNQDIDVLVSIEAISVRESLQRVADRTRVLALDLCANTQSFDVKGPSKIAFVSKQAGLDDLCRDLKLSGLAYGPSVATAAFRLACRWGADPIVLLGQDLAFPEGRVYAKGTGREGWRVDAEGDVLRFRRDEHINRLFESHGLRRPSDEQPRLCVDAWGSNGNATRATKKTVDTTYDLTWFRRWFENAAKEDRSGRRLINATEGGASIEGFEERTLASLLDELPTREACLGNAIGRAKPLSKKRIDQARRSLQRSARRVAHEAERFAKSKSAHQANIALQTAKASSVVWAHALGEVQRIQADESLPPIERTIGTIRALRRSAKQVMALLS